MSGIANQEIQVSFCSLVYLSHAERLIVLYGCDDEHESKQGVVTGVVTGGVNEDECDDADLITLAYLSHGCLLRCCVDVVREVQVRFGTGVVRGGKGWGRGLPVFAV